MALLKYKIFYRNFIILLILIALAGSILHLARPDLESYGDLVNGIIGLLLLAVLLYLPLLKNPNAEIPALMGNVHWAKED